MGLDVVLGEPTTAAMASVRRSADRVVQFLPGEDPEQERRFDMEAGYLPVRAPLPGTSAPRDDAHLYFMLHRAMHPQPRRKLVFWLNGGPGCSSFDGALLELGALRIQRDGNLTLARPGHAWNEYADVVYVDQPVGTGYSYVANGAYAQSLAQVADEFVYFVREFMQVYPAYTNETDVYLAGESLYVHGCLRQCGAVYTADGAPALAGGCACDAAWHCDWEWRYRCVAAERRTSRDARQSGDVAQVRAGAPACAAVCR